MRMSMCSICNEIVSRTGLLCAACGAPFHELCYRKSGHCSRCLSGKPPRPLVDRGGVGAAGLIALTVVLAAAGRLLSVQDTGHGVAITSSHPGVPGSAPSLLFDCDLDTAFASTLHDWQYIQFQYSGLRTIRGVRRHMKLLPGVRPFGGDVDRRVLQGEGVSSSTDQVTFTSRTGPTTTGWEEFENYRPYAWHSVRYGWSPWLRPKAPVQARALRFSWSGDHDAVCEIQVDAE